MKMEGFEVIEKVAESSGNSGRIYVPKKMDWKKSTSGVIGMSSFALYKRQKQLEDENAELKKQLLAVLKKNY